MKKNVSLNFSQTVHIFLDFQHFPANIYLLTFSSVSIVDFKQVSVSWVRTSINLNQGHKDVIRIS